MANIAGMEYTKDLIKYAKRRERVRRWLDSGKSALWVAKRLGVSRQRVYQLQKPREGR